MEAKTILTEEVNVKFTVDISKRVPSEKGLVSGWANVSVLANGDIPLDWEGDIIAPEELEDAAIEFMENYAISGVMHTGDPVGTVVESIMFTKEKQEAIGIPPGTVPEGWFITVKIHDTEVRQKVKDGVYSMFSIQGKGQRVQL